MTESQELSRVDLARWALRKNINAEIKKKPTTISVVVPERKKSMIGRTVAGTVKAPEGLDS